MTYPKQTLNPAQAVDQRRIGSALVQLQGVGWSRRALAAVCDDLNPYAVWRAQNGRVRVGEVQLWDGLIGRITSGELRPPLAPRSLAVEERVQRALAALDRADRARSVSTLREIVDEARSALRD